MKHQVKSLSELPLLYKPAHESYAQAWHGHRGFAQALIKTLRPGSFVELGVHGGDSYFTFAEALKLYDVNCNSYAVDVWKGDQQSGTYGENIYESVCRENEKYKNSSTLLRMTFDQAAKVLNNISLLHIDGLHTYDAVKKDYDTWNNKVNDMIIFHDINVPWNPDFGVWKLWEEIKEASTFQCFEFMHCFGLAVLCKSQKAVDAVEAIINPQ
jgi:hypothetical protein